MVQLTLDAAHRSNLRWSIQVLGLTQLRPLSGGSFGVAPGTLLRATPGPLATVPYGERKSPLPMTESQDAATVEAEIASFEAEAYGAAPGVIYYRAIGDKARLRWDERVQRVLDKLRKQMEDIDTQGRNNWMQAQSAGAPSPAFQQSYQQLGQQKQAIARHLDFMVSLQMTKQSVFPSSRFVEFNDDSVVARTPWCQCDAEFRLTAWQMLSGQAKGPPVINRGYDEEERKKSLREEVTAAFNTILTAKVTDYMEDFLELGAGVLRGALREGFELIIRHIPVVDLFIDFLKDKFAEMQVKQLVEQYRQDEQRRFFLRRMNWGTYEREAIIATPTGGLPKGVSAR